MLRADVWGSDGACVRWGSSGLAHTQGSVKVREACLGAVWGGLLALPSRSSQQGVWGEKKGRCHSLYTEVWEEHRTCEARESFSGVRRTLFSHARRAICCVERVVGGYGRCGEKSEKRGDARGVEEIHQQPGHTRARRSIATHGRTCAEGRKGVGAPTETWGSGRGKGGKWVLLGNAREDTRSLVVSLFLGCYFAESTSW
jgi:hypothetical protein